MIKNPVLFLYRSKNLPVHFIPTQRFFSLFSPDLFSLAILESSTENITKVCLKSFLFSDMDTHILDYTDVQLEVEVAGPEPSTSAAPPPSAAAPHMLAPALTSNNHLSSLLLKDPTLQVQH